MQEENIDRLIGYLGEVSAFLSQIKFKMRENEQNIRISETVENYLDSFLPTTAPMRRNVDLQFDNKSAKNRLTFTKKELENMPQNYKNIFACQDNIVFYRIKPNGVYEARFHREGIHIEVSSKDPTVLKAKFLRALQKKAEKDIPVNVANTVLFNDYIDEWLAVKKRTIKASTYGEYDRLVTKDIKPFLAGKRLTEISRQMLQNFLFSYTDAGKHRTAEKIHLILRCVFDVAFDDYDLKSPMRKIVLPYREIKSGCALTIEEEKALIDFCIKNISWSASSGLLVLLFFGLRKSELKTIKVDGESLTCISSKTLMGRNEQLRRIPFTPNFKKVLQYVDFEKAKNTNTSTIDNTLKKIFPNHHTHELRYTFITRCKECGVNPEIVMLWDGHEEDKDVRSSKIDRGYTDFSWSFQLKQAELVDYDL
jgi:integrase